MLYSKEQCTEYVTVHILQVSQQLTIKVIKIIAGVEKHTEHTYFKILQETMTTNCVYKALCNE